ncbi:MAG: hypothetical protein AAF998_23580 [Bacteroidota bacterium]
MNIIVLKTDIPDQKSAQRLASVFGSQPSIIRWTVDTEDIDKVLRIEDDDTLSEQAVIRLVQRCGVAAAPLPD